MRNDLRKKYIAFDIDGVLSYPGFENVLSVLSKDPKNVIGFWSVGSASYTREQLNLYQLLQYSQFIVDGEEFGHMTGHRSPETPITSEYVRAFIKYSGLPRIRSYEKYFTEQMLAFTQTKAFFKKTAGILPQPAVLVDSDNSYFSRDKIERSGITPLAFKSAMQGRHSLILLPEHPDIWESGLIQIKPETVMDTLLQKLSQWNGEHIAMDIGEDLGIYREDIGPGLERR